MPKVSNVYQKSNGRWYFVANLGTDENGKRIQHWGSSYATQKEAKTAYDEYMFNHGKSAVKVNSTMTYKEFFDTYYEPDYKSSVTPNTYNNRISTMKLHFKFFITQNCVIFQHRK